MDYSELVEAIIDEDIKTANRLCGDILPILKKYLIATVGAKPEDAEDAVQRMFEYVIPKIQNNEIKSPSGLLAYMLTASRHSYFKIKKEYDSHKFELIDDSLVAEPEQPWGLLDKDQETILKKCIKELKGHYKKLIQFLFDYPNADSEDIAEFFDISVSNAWIRKHRMIQKLNECVRKKFK